ncbi:MAG: cyclic pyranopterin monophosphate synthase MoaC, partial [Pseudomonadota bacterium]
MTLSHINSAGEAAMVDIGDKPITQRSATACGVVRMRKETLALILSGTVAK